MLCDSLTRYLTSKAGKRLHLNVDFVGKRSTVAHLTHKQQSSGLIPIGSCLLLNAIIIACLVDNWFQCTGLSFQTLLLLC